MTSKLLKFITLFLLLLSCSINSQASSVKISDLTRIDGIRDNALVGYGIVMGLNGSGDSRRSKATLQSVANALLKFGVFVDINELSSRNVAAVMVTATLPAFSEIGNKLDVNIASIGDARSLTGGTLLLTPLNAVNGELVALSQGPVSVGGYTVEAFGNKVQKNHPTVGIIPQGAVVERATNDQFLAKDGSLKIIIKEPSFNTANQIVKKISSVYPDLQVTALHAGKIKIVPVTPFLDPVAFLASIQELKISPVTASRIVINERTGTVVAGGLVQIDDVTITHGSLKIQVKTRYQVSQPDSVVLGGGWIVPGAPSANENVRTVVVPETDIIVDEQGGNLVDLRGGATVSDLISALNSMRMSTRDIITILQAINRAGALHGELIIQ